MTETTKRCAILALVACATMACSPGEVERRYTEAPTIVVCSDNLVSLPYSVCGEVKDGQQDCRTEWRMQSTCNPPAPIVTVICVPADEAKTGVQ